MVMKAFFFLMLGHIALHENFIFSLLLLFACLLDKLISTLISTAKFKGLF